MNIVVYSGLTETLVCSSQDESKLLKDYFLDGGRSTEDYDRIEISPGMTARIQVSSNARVDYLAELAG